MGDSRGIDVLRALALSSMPSMGKRPLPRTNSRSVDVFEPRRPLVSAAVRPKSDDKEEGELSSDDEAEHSAAPRGAVEASMSDAFRRLSSHVPSRESMKDRRHTSAMTATDFESRRGVPQTSVSSASACVSIVNKSQLLSAFNAQAPPLISSGMSEPVHSGRSGPGVLGKQPKPSKVQVTSSHAERRSSNCGISRGAGGKPLFALSQTPLQPPAASPVPSLSHEHQNGGPTDGTVNFRFSCSPSTQISDSIPKQVSSSKLQKGGFPIPQFGLPNVEGDGSALLGSVTASGAGEAKNAPGQASVFCTAAISGIGSGNPASCICARHGAFRDCRMAYVIVESKQMSELVSLGSGASTSVGGEQPACPSTSAVEGVRAVRKEGGVRTEAEAFLASLRIPLRKPDAAVPNGTAVGDEREDAFLIKFDDDGDSDGENESPQIPTSKAPDRSMHKGPNSGSVLRNGNAVLQLNPVVPNQSSSDLKSEINRMKKKIAAMERTKSTTVGSAGHGRLSKMLSGDGPRHAMHPPAEPKSGAQLAAGNVRPAPVDLESMRIQIAAKETELQQRRQRMAVKGPENGKGVNDVKGTGVSWGPPLLTVGSSQATGAVITQMGNGFVKPSSEEGIVGSMKEVQPRADGNTAHPSSERGGANHTESGATAGDKDKQCLNDFQTTVTAPDVAPRMKRHCEDGAPQEVHKVPRLETSARKKTADEEVAKGGALPLNTKDTFTDKVNQAIKSRQASSQMKRKLDALPAPSSKAASKAVADTTSSPAFEAAKKVKANSAVTFTQSRREVSEVVNSKQSSRETGQSAATFLPTTDAAQVSTLLSREQTKPGIQINDTPEQIAQRPLSNLATRTKSGIEADGVVENRREELATSIPPLPDATEVRVPIKAVQKAPLARSTSSNGMNCVVVNGTTDVSGFQQPVRGREPSQVSLRAQRNSLVAANLSQAGTRPDEFFANRTGTVLAERESMALGTSNVDCALSAEMNGCHTTISWRPVNPMSVCAPTSVSYQLEHSLRPGLSGTEKQSMDEDGESFQRILDEEERLDRDLEEAQQARRRCEQRERASRKEYREAQHALRMANANCDLLNQKKDFLLSQLHAASARHWSERPFVGRLVVPYGGNSSTYTQGTTECSLPLVGAPNPMPARRAEEVAWGGNVTYEHGPSGQVHGVVSPLSLNRVDIAAVSHRHSQSGPATEKNEGISCSLVKEMTVDGRERASRCADVTGGESSVRNEDHRLRGQIGEQNGPVAVRRQEDGEAGLFVDDSSQAASQQLTCYRDRSHFDGQRFPSSEVGNSNLEISESPAQGVNIARNKTSASESPVMEDIQAATQMLEPSSSAEIPRDFCALDQVSNEGIRGATSPVRVENVRRLDASQAQVPGVLDIEQSKGGEKASQAVEQSTSATTSKDARHPNSLGSAPKISPFTHELSMKDSQVSVLMDKKGNLSPCRNIRNDPPDDISDTEPRDAAEHPVVDGLVVRPAAAIFPDGQICIQSEIPDTSAHGLGGGISWSSLEEPLSSQAVLHDNKDEGEICKDDGGEVEDTPLESERSSAYVSDNVRPASGAGTDGARVNIGSSAETFDDRFVEPNGECAIPPLLIASDPSIEVPGEDGFAEAKDSHWASSNAVQDRTTLANSFVNGILVHPEERENGPIAAESISQGDFPHPSIADGGMQQHVDVSKSREAQNVHVTENTQLVTGDRQSKSSMSPDKVNQPLDNLLDTESPSLAASHEVSCDAAESPGRVRPPNAVRDVCDHDTIFHTCQPCLMCVKDGRLGSDASLMLLTDTEGQNCSGSDSHLDFAEEHRPCEDGFREFISQDTVTVQDACKDVPKVVDTDAAIVKSKSLSQDQEQIMAVGSEGERHHQVKVDCFEVGCAQRNDGMGAEVETFRKALRDDKTFRITASGGDSVDAGKNCEQRNGDQVSKQMLTQSQHHRLDHLLDIVEVSGPEMSLGGDSAGVEETQGMDCVPMSGAGKVLQPNRSPPENCGATLQSATQLSAEVLTGEASLSPALPGNSIVDEGKRWGASEAYLAVIGCIPRDAHLPPGCDSRASKETLSAGEDSEQPSNNFLTLSRYESPLTTFRSYRTLPQFAEDLRLKCHSTTWSHAISPFKPLCKFEQRGKCNNADCPWQHADDYTLLSAHVESQMQNYIDLQTRMSSDEHATAAPGFHTTADLASEAVSLPSRDCSVTAVIIQAQTSGREALIPYSSGGLSPSLPMNWIDCEARVPTYCTGSYTLKRDDSNRSSFLSYRLQLNRKVDSFRSFLFSPSIHKQLPRDTPCLLESSRELSSFIGIPPLRPKSPHWRYMGELQEKLISTKDRGARMEAISEETWLELALHHIDYDIRTANDRARDQALYYLSRALESKTSSVALWTLYSCLFYMRDEDPDKDVMFRHAVQYNRGSYELWILYINSRSDLQSRVEASENAVVAIVDAGMVSQRDKHEISACILDIQLQMLYCWSVARCWDDFSLWVDDLIDEASFSPGDRKSRRGCNAALLSQLTQRDACVLWTVCAYCLACDRLPNDVILRLGCKQELPDGLNWEEHAKVDELTQKRVMKAMSTALGRGPGCLSLDSGEAAAGDEESLPRQVLAVNYVQCILLYEGLERAVCVGQELLCRFPKSLELIILCARLEHCLRGPIAGLHVFEEAIPQWSRNASGVQCLWNQYAGHALLWGGPDLAKTSFVNCVALANLHHPGEVRTAPVGCDSIQTPDSLMIMGQNERIHNNGAFRETWNGLKEFFVALTSANMRIDRGAGSSREPSEHENSVFSLINLALIEVLDGDIAAARLAINRAIQAASSHKDLRHCWRELAALQLVSPKKTHSRIRDSGMLSVLDDCKTNAVLHLTPLSQKAFQDFKKPHIRKFFEDLLGPIPLDNSVLNSILHTFYGSQMLPLEVDALKEVFHFAEGLLEAIPGNVPLALSLCKMVHKNSEALKQMYMSTAVWACALLVSALVQSCPQAPEIDWVEAGSMLRKLVGEERSLEEFYGIGLTIYPFSAALQQDLKADRERLRTSGGDPARVMQMSPTKVAVLKATQCGVESRVLAQVVDMKNGHHRPVQPSEG